MSPWEHLRLGIFFRVADSQEENNRSFIGGGNRDAKGDEIRKLGEVLERMNESEL
ncbi:MAG TPA: hypothetical protein VJ921_06110 [Vicinamibacteria bacterium]|nr:hypothetical protein [Vicinamibacteria bacterium]